MYYKIEQLKSILASHNSYVFSLDHLCSSALEYIQHLEAGIDRCYELAKRVESAQPKWISVEERLPEPKMAVLTCGLSIQIGYSRGIGEGWFTFDDKPIDNVGFWMPLPEPPKED